MTQRVSDNRSFQDLTEVAGSLWDSDALERRLAADAAVNFPDSVPLLVARLCVERDSRVFGALESALVSIGSEAVVMGVLPLLRAPVPAVRIAGADILRALGSRSAPVARSLLSDEDPALRVIGITILSSVPNPKVTSWLNDVLARDNDADVCQAALDALAGRTTTELVPTLRDLHHRFPERDDLKDAVSFVLGRLERQGDGECACS